MKTNNNLMLCLECNKQATDIIPLLAKVPIEGVMIALFRSDGSNGVTSLLRDFIRQKKEYHPGVAIKYWDREDLHDSGPILEPELFWINIYAETFETQGSNVIIIDDFHLYQEQYDIWDSIYDQFYDSEPEQDVLVLLGVNERRYYDLKLIDEVSKQCDFVVRIDMPTERDVAALMDLYAPDAVNLLLPLSKSYLDVKTIINHLKTNSL